MMQRSANENAAGLHRICKRSDQPKIERLVKNDATAGLLRSNMVLIFAHGCYVTSMSIEGSRMVLDHSLTHSLDSD